MTGRTIRTLLAVYGERWNMIRNWYFKRLIKKVNKLCNKYKQCKDCPFGRDTTENGMELRECNLIKWENGADRYPYELKELV